MDSSKLFLSHYDWLRAHWLDFVAKVGTTNPQDLGILAAHGDKAYGFKSKWADAGIPFNHGVAIYLLSRCRPYSEEVRSTPSGWVSPDDWVIQNYPRFRDFLAPADQY